MKLKALSLPDLEQVRLWRNEQLSCLRTPFLLTQEQQAEFFKNVICNRQANARFWGIWQDCGDLQPEEECLHFIGMCGLENIQWENRLAETSLLLSPNHADKTGEALRLLLYEGFMNLNLVNICFEVYACNPGLEFWTEIIAKYSCITAQLPYRKYRDGIYYPSTYINIFKGAFAEYENLILEPAQTLN